MFPKRLPGKSGTRDLGLLLLLALVLYLATLDNGLAPGELEGGDLITHQYAQVQARPGNAPGYPLYTMGGWLWFHGWRGLLTALGNPLPNPIPILSSYSTLWALMALWLLYRLLRHLSRTPDRPAGDPLLAWIITVFYGVTYFFWYYATTTEQYSSAVAHTLAIVYVYLLWADRADGQDPGADRYLYLLAFLCGLCLAHMITVAFVVPMVVLLVLWQQPHILRRPVTVTAIIGVAALPLLSYLYVYARGAAHPQWWGAGQWQSPGDWFWSFVSTAQGREELSWGLQPGAPLWGNGFPELIWQELSVPVLLLAGLGLFGLGRRPTLLISATLLLYGLFCWVDRFGNWFQVILPAYPLLLLGLVGSYGAAERWWTGRYGAAASDRRRLAATALGLLLILWRVWASWPQVDSRDRPGDTALLRPRQLLAQPIPLASAAFAPVQDALGLRYLTEIWGVRPDVTLVSSRQAGEVLAEGRPVVVTADAAPLLLSELGPLPDLKLDSMGPDWILLHQGDPCPSLQGEGRCALCDCGDLRHTAQDVGDGIRLAGYRLERSRGPDGTEIEVILYWQRTAGQDPPHPWSISVRPLRDGAYLRRPGGGWVQTDRTGPVHGLWPFDRLAESSWTGDGYRLILPNDQEADGVAVLLYRSQAGGFENLTEIQLPIR